MARIIRRRRQEDTGRQDRLTALLQTIANIDAEITAKAAERARLVTETEGIFVDLGRDPVIVETDHGTYVAQEVASAGRSSSHIDPVGFRKLVKNDKDFFSAITVLKKPAEQLLSGKELASITSTTPAVAGEPVFSVGPAATQKGKKK
jgi:hypothetical protein